MQPSQDSDAVIEVDDLVMRFGKQTVLAGLDLKVRRGETLVVMGGSGCGKSTLLRLMIGSLQPTQGAIRLFGQDIGRTSEQELDGVRRRFGILFQSGALYQSMSIADNVALPMRELRTLPDAFVVRVAMLKLQMVGLKASDADKMPADLSGGMIKRVALARALSLEPELVFLDEPTAGLDPRASDDYVALIRELRRELGLTVVMVTHDLDTLVALSDRIAVLADRKVLAAKPIEQIIQIDHPFIKEYFLGERGKRALMALGPQMTEAVAAASLSTQED